MGTSEFDRLFQTADPLFEQVYATDYTLTRGESAATVSGQLLIQQIEETDDRGFRHTVQAVAILMSASDYLIGGVATTPIGGDTFTNGSKIYTVTPRAKGRCWEPQDADESQIVVFVKRTT